nr:SMR family transporter [Cytobacillus sp.]
MTLLRMSLEEIPLSVAYAVWTGIGTVGATITKNQKVLCVWFVLLE